MSIGRFTSEGIDEDPVTGSAHTALGPYWAEQLGKTEFTAYQVSARGGVVRVFTWGRIRPYGKPLRRFQGI